MRLIFLLLLCAVTADAQVPPLLRGPFTTNTPQAQLTLATNIALSVATNRIASSNANYVLKNNGTATGFLSVENQTNSGTLDVTGNAQFFSDTYFIASAIHVYGDKSDFSNSVAFYQPAVSKLAAFDALHHLTNSAYSDQTIADLQAATNSLQTQLTAATNALNVASNALRTAVGTTNLYALIQSGFLNNVTSTNGNFYSATNTAQASNHVVVTFKGVTGQTNNLLEWGTNNTSGNMIRQGVIDHNGNVGIGTNAPAQALDVIGNVKVSGVTTNSGGLFWSSDGGGDIGANGASRPGTIYSANGIRAGSFLMARGQSIWDSTSDGNLYLANVSINGLSSFRLGPAVNWPQFYVSTNPIATISYNGAIQVTNWSVFIGPLTNKSTIYAPTNTAPWIVNQGDVSSFGMALSNVNGSASTSLTTGITLSSNVYAYVFSSAGGTPLTLSLATNSNYPDGQIWSVTLGTEGTNILSLTPTNFSAGTADKISRSTNWIITPGMSITLQKQGTNFNIISGLPSDPIGTIKSWHKNFPGVCTNLSSSWVECRGQTLSDVGSPLNGQIIPALVTGNQDTCQFLNGSADGTPTGTFGGSTTSTAPLSNGAFTVDPGATTDVVQLNSFTGSFSIVPPFMTVIWIMRVK